MNKETKKTLLFWEDGRSVSVNLSFNEMLTYNNRYCERIINKFANDCANATKDLHGNIMEKEDFVNEGIIRAFYCFEKYEPNRSFASYLQNGLEQWWKDYTKSVFAQKRKTQSEMVSFDCQLDNGTYLKDIEGDFDSNFAEFEYNEGITDAISKLTDEEKAITNFLLNEEITKKNLAEQLGMSRPTLDSRIIKVKDKIIDLLPEYITY